MVEAGSFTPADERVLKLLGKGIPTILLANKLDNVGRRGDIAPWLQQMQTKHEFAEFVPMSAKNAKDVERLFGICEKYLPEQPWFYDEDELTDRSEKFLASELVREKLFRLTGDELPYTSTVVIDKFDEEAPQKKGHKRLLRIAATIVVERDSHKAMVIGDKGERIKRIGMETRYDWSESSLILEVFTRHHGRIALVAKGAKRPSSNFRPVLLPLQPLEINYGGDAEIRTLKGAEWMGGHVMPTGDALLSGYYLNELLLRLLARDDAHEALFDAYGGVVQVLAGDHGGAQAATQAAALRAFELLLLRGVGLLPQLDVQTLTLESLEAGTRYALVAEAGLRAAADDEAALAGADWQRLQAALDDRAPFTATLRLVATLSNGSNSALRNQLRALLNYHCGVSTLRTRQLMRDIQAL